MTITNHRLLEHYVTDKAFAGNSTGVGCYMHGQVAKDILYKSWRAYRRQFDSSGRFDKSF